jgi:hypothetical protein
MADTVVRFRGDAKDLNAKLAQVQRGLTGLQARSATANRALGSIQKSASAVSGALRVAATAFAAFATTRAVGGIVSATQSMEGFRTQLTTYLGTQERANAEIARLSQLARQLPQDVNELTEAFVIFNRVGLDASNENMIAFSNIAAANSKSITQFAEAVADGMTGEFERFKEFGIKVSKESGVLTAKIGEDSVATARSTTELVNQLIKLGQEGGRFGSVTVGPLTLAMSNFRGALFETSAALGEGGFGLAISETVTAITELITGSDTAVQAIGTNLTKAFLYTVEVGKFLIANIGLIGKALLLLISIKAALFFANFAKAIFLIAIPALVALGKQIKNAIGILSFLVPGGALIKGVVAGIGVLATAWGVYKGATSEAAKETVDSMMDIDGILKGLGVQGIDELRQGFEDVNSEAERLSQLAAENARAMSQTEAAQAAVADQTAKAAARQEAQTKSFEDYLQAKQEELRVSRMTTLEQEKYKAVQDAVKELGDAIGETEKQKLRDLVQQNDELTKQAEKQKEIADAIAEVTRAATEVEAIQAGGSAMSRMNPAEEMRKKYETELRGLKILRDNDAISEEKYLKTKLDLHREYEDAIFDLQKQQAEERLRQNGVVNDEIIRQTMGQMDQVKMIQQGGIQGIQGVLGATANVFQQLGGQNKKAFEAYKALAIAQALISTYQAAAMAIAFPPGPPLSFIYVAGAVAAGMAQVAAIQSQQYSGRQLGGPVMGGTGYIVGENGPELFTPNTTGSITPNRQLGGSGDVTVNFQILANDTTGFDELLYNRKGLITQIISDAMAERGQRMVV